MKLSWKIPAATLVALLNFGCGGVETGLSANPTSPGAPIAANTTEAVAGSPGAAEFLARNAAQGFASVEDRSVGQNRFLVFTSRGDLIPADTNGVRDVYLRDLRTGEMRLISVATNGTQGNGDSTQGSISADGRFVVFRSAATNLVTGDGNGVTDIFLHEIATGTTTRVSTATGGTEVSGASLTPAISANGRYVVFASSAPNLVATDSNGAQDIFLKDVTTDTTTLVSSNSAQTDSANGASFDPAITAGTTTEGEFIAFSTEATDIVAGGLNGQRQVVRIERAAPGTRVLVSQSAGAVQADGPCYEPSLSNDGNTIAFFTLATNLGAVADGNGFFDVYTRNISGNTTTNQSVNTGGNPSDGHSGYPSLSADGSVVAFGSLATDLVAGDSNGRFDVFRRESGSTSLASQATDTTAGNSDSDLPGISLDGRYVAFRSAASTLSSHDSTTDDDIFVRDSLTPATTLQSIACRILATFAGVSGSTFTTGLNPIDTAVADFDGDGNLDVATADRGDNTVSVLLGNGSGGLGTASSFAVGTTPVPILARDFNGDDNVDLAVANYAGGNVSILIGDGTGGFAAAANFMVGAAGGANPLAMVTADFNGDNNLDLAVANDSTDDTTILLGNGAGGFTLAANLDHGFVAVRDIAQGDFNGDTFPDLAVLKSNREFLLFFGDGTGAFGPSTSITTESNPAAITTTDFNGDGDLDIATLHAFDDVQVFLGDGTGGFSAPTGFPPAVGGSGGGAQRAKILPVDLDGDGNLDLISTGGSRGLSFLPGNGDGTFGAATEIDEPGRSLSVGDFDNDGYLDLVAADSSPPNDDQVLILLNQRPDWPGLNTPASTFATPNGAFYVSLGDMNGDGFLDAVTANVLDDTISIQTNNGAGAFSTPTPYSSGSTPRSVALGDVDNDGDLDVAVARQNGIIGVYINDGTGTLTGPTNFSAGAFPYSLTFGDVDKDGDLDLVVPNANSDDVSVLLNTGTGTFAAAVNYSVDSGPTQAALADIDGDGDLDIVTANGFGLTVSTLLNDGTGAFSGLTTFTSGTNCSSLALGDIDGDSDLDLVVANLGNNNVSIFLNNGPGTFGGPTRLAVGNSPNFIKLDDLDGDGDLDIATVNRAGNDISVLLNSGSGTFSSARSFGPISNPDNMTLGDVDGDGDLDFVAVSNINDTLSVLLNQACP